MVQLMSSMRKTTAGVKLEYDDSFDDHLSPLHKRSKLQPSSQISMENTSCSSVLLKYNPLDEPSPLGLRLKKSPSFLDLIQMKLSQENASQLARKNQKSGGASSGGSEKLKASNFPASVLQIGTWEYKSRYEGDLVAKCYFAKHKLVWEVLDGGLKNKIEIQWSDIMAIKAKFSDDGPDTLDVALARQPLFFRETNPQPRKHTLWQATSDFTGGQASLHRRHFLQSPRGLLGKHYEKLIQCDPRLNYLSQQPDVTLDSPYFELRMPVFDDQKESGHASYGFADARSPSGAQTSSRNEHDSDGGGPENLALGSTSSGSVMDNHAIEEISSSRIPRSQIPSEWEHIKVPGIHPSMSMSDFVSQIGHCITEQMQSTNPSFSGRGQQDVLEDITQFLLGDTDLATASNEQTLLSRVNSLCCLLQKDPETIQNFQTKGSCGSVDIVKKDGDEKLNLLSACEMAGASTVHNGPSTDNAGCKQGMSRKDSVGDLLLNLPRIASLPQFLHFNTDDTDNQAR